MLRTICLHTLLSAAFAAGPASPAHALAEEASDPAKFQAEDVFALEWASSPRVSPDGRTIAYVRNGFDNLKDTSTGRIWLVDADGSNHRPLADLAGANPRWSPDGKRIAFLSGTDQGVEILMHWLDESRTARITQLPEQPSSLEFSPDGRWLAFGMFEPAPVEPMAKGPTPPEGATWAPAFKVYDKVSYRFDGQGYLEPGFSHLYVVPAEGGSPRRVTSGEFNHGGGFAWTRDGSALIVSANRREDWEYEPQDTNLYRVALADGTITALTDRFGPDGAPAVSPDGRHLAYLGYDDALRGYANTLLYVMDLATGESRALGADLDRSIDAFVWDEDSRHLFVQYDDHGTGHLARMDQRGATSAIVSDLGGTGLSRPYSGGDFHQANGVVAYTRSSADRPADLAVVSRGKTSSITHLNEDALAHKRLSTVEAVRFASALDGREIEAWIVKPPGYEAGKRYPLILEIHGGPFAAYGPHFAAELQLYGAAGYVTLYVNPRGSTSYGDEFANLIHHAYPGGDFDDLMSAVDYAIAQGIADPAKLFVTGGSGGGILTAWIVTHTDRFAAAVSAKPVINWYSFVLTADAYVFFQRYWFAKPPWEDPEGYLARSPLSYIDRVTTPTMLLTGEQDHRTPISESEQFYQALKLRKVPTALVRVPEASHGIAARPSHLIAKTLHVLAWFERYMPE